MQILNHITLDFSRPNVAVLDYAVQGDEYSRGVVAQLVGGSQAWTPPAGAGAFIEYRRADGAPGLYDALENGDAAVTVDGSSATLLFSAHALQVSGQLAVALRFVDIDGRKLRSFEFVVNVKRELVSDSDVTTDPYYNILSQQIAAVLNAAESLTGMAVSNTTLPPGSAATAVITGGEGGVPYNIDFGIPRGDTGATGPQGPKGDPGAGAPSDAIPLMDGTASAGTSDLFSRGDHRHPLANPPSDALPLMDGTASAGTSGLFARGDHVHPSSIAPTQLSVGGAGSDIMTGATISRLIRSSAVRSGNVVVFSFIATVSALGSTNALFTLRDGLAPGSDVDFVLLHDATGAGISCAIAKQGSVWNIFSNLALPSGGNRIRAQVSWIISQEAST